MQAIMFELDHHQLEKSYPGVDFNLAYADIRSVMSKFGFTRWQGNLFLANYEVDAVSCVLVSQELASKFPWFSDSVVSIRMLRIEENCDLMPVVDYGLKKSINSEKINAVNAAFAKADSIMEQKRKN